MNQSTASAVYWQTRAGMSSTACIVNPAMGKNIEGLIGAARGD